jgi:hypothetical protein
MARRNYSPFNGKRFIGNKNTMEVHDLDNEKLSCRINEIKHEHVVTFYPDAHSTAKSNGYDNCAHCIGGSTR